MSQWNNNIFCSCRMCNRNTFRNLSEKEKKKWVKSNQDWLITLFVLEAALGTEERREWQANEKEELQTGDDTMAETVTLGGGEIWSGNYRTPWRGKWATLVKWGRLKIYARTFCATWASIVCKGWNTNKSVVLLLVEWMCRRASEVSKFKKETGNLITNWTLNSSNQSTEYKWDQRKSMPTI